MNMAGTSVVGPGNLLSADCRQMQLLCKKLLAESREPKAAILQSLTTEIPRLRQCYALLSWQVALGMTRGESRR